MKKSNKADYRNIAVPKDLHRQVAHIALDHDISVSEITAALLKTFCEVNRNKERGPLNFLRPPYLGG